MDDDDKREIIQLFIVAENEFNIGKKFFIKLDNNKLILTMKEISDDIKINGLNEDNKKLVLLISHFDSSCLRLSTIYEVLNMKPKDADLYNKLIREPNKMDYLCHFLRDGIAHKEPDDWHLIRQNFINNLTVKDIYDGTYNTFNNVINTIKKYKTIFTELVKYIK